MLLLFCLPFLTVLSVDRHDSFVRSSLIVSFTYIVQRDNPSTLINLCLLFSRTLTLLQGHSRRRGKFLRSAHGNSSGRRCYSICIWRGVSISLQVLLLLSMLTDVQEPILSLSRLRTRRVYHCLMVSRLINRQWVIAIMLTFICTGFNSGVLGTQGNSSIEAPVWSLTITNASEREYNCAANNHSTQGWPLVAIWYFCEIVNPESHCAAGMVG